MIIKLSEKWINKMINLPESGMGYQKVKVKLNNGITLEGVVMNSDSLEVDSPNVFNNDDIDNINILL